MTLAILVLSGTVGVGKTTIGEEVHDVLSERGIPNAFFDLDALRYQWPATSPWNAELLVEHLTALWPNLARRDVTHLVLAGVRLGQAQRGHRELIAAFILQNAGVASDPAELHLMLLAKRQQPFPEIRTRHPFGSGAQSSAGSRG